MVHDSFEFFNFVMGNYYYKHYILLFDNDSGNLTLKDMVNRCKRRDADSDNLAADGCEQMN